VRLAATDRFAAARAVADAVLYEGYVLYPYRASSRKNQARWQFGVLVPPAFGETDASERSSARTECLVDPGTAPVLHVRLRCLQVQHRTVEAPAAGPAAGDFVPVGRLDVEGRVYVEWDEAVDQIVDIAPLSIAGGGAAVDQRFAFRAGSDTEQILTGAGTVAGRIVRRREEVEGVVRVRAMTAAGERPLVKVVVTVENATTLAGASRRRDDAVGFSLVAVHMMLAVDDGAFVSLLDPPESAKDAVAGCSSDGAFPVLIGGDDVMLASPIILYDQPEVAPESPGDLYDATEIDEILALRVLTLTDEEKSEARGTDPRAAAIIDRCDDMAPEIWERLHGAVRSLGSADHAEDAGEPAQPAQGGNLGRDGAVVAATGRTWWDAGRDGAVGAGTGPGWWEPGRGDPDGAGLGPAWWEPGAEAPVVPGKSAPWWDPGVDASVDPWADSLLVGGVAVAKGTAVRLRPSHRADAQDLFLDGLTATVAGVFRDVDGNEHVAVTVDDDPATEELSWQGRYLFFHPDEVEPLPQGGAGRR
jgi:hypothetical protein